MTLMQRFFFVFSSRLYLTLCPSHYCEWEHLVVISLHLAQTPIKDELVKVHRELTNPDFGQNSSNAYTNLSSLHVQCDMSLVRLVYKLQPVEEEILSTIHVQIYTINVCEYTTQCLVKM